MAKSRKKKVIISLLAVAVLGALVFVAVTQNRVERKEVRVEEAGFGDIVSMVTATGRVEAKRDVQISADVMGRITDLPVKEGQAITTGDLLLQIDRTRYQADVARARAALTTANAALEKAELAFRRNTELYEREMISRDMLDFSRSDLHSVQGSVAQAVASLEQARDQLLKTTIRSPMDGTITALYSERGENVVIGTMNNPGTVIMVISDLSTIEVKAEVDETDIAQVKIEQEVEIELDAFPDTTFWGTVTEIGNSARVTGASSQNQVVNFSVVILITDAVEGIRPGMSATVDIATAKSDNVVVVPIQSIVMRAPSDLVGEDDEGKEESGAVASEVNESEDTVEASDKEDEEEIPVEGVFLVIDGEATFAAIKTGIADQRDIEIIEGISKGDSVITGSYKILRSLEDGDAVEPVSKDKED